MAFRTGRCTNDLYCSFASARQDLQIPADAKFLCPQCGKPLVEPSAASGGGSMRIAIIAGSGLAVAGAALFIVGTMMGHGGSATAPAPVQHPAVASPPAAPLAVTPATPTPPAPAPETASAPQPAPPATPAQANTAPQTARPGAAIPAAAAQAVPPPSPQPNLAAAHVPAPVPPQVTAPAAPTKLALQQPTAQQARAEELAAQKADAAKRDAAAKLLAQQQAAEKRAQQLEDKRKAAKEKAAAAAAAALAAEQAAPKPVPAPVPLPPPVPEASYVPPPRPVPAPSGGQTRAFSAAPISGGSPQYPAVYESEGRSGRVTVSCTITAGGSPSGCHVVGSAGGAAFGQSVMQWLGSGRVRFAPILHNGAAAAESHTWTLSFQP